MCGELLAYQIELLDLNLILFLKATVCVFVFDTSGSLQFKSRTLTIQKSSNRSSGWNGCKILQSLALMASLHFIDATNRDRLRSFAMYTSRLRNAALTSFIAAGVVLTLLRQLPLHECASDACMKHARLQSAQHMQERVASMQKHANTWLTCNYSNAITHTFVIGAPLARMAQCWVPRSVDLRLRLPSARRWRSNSDAGLCIAYAFDETVVGCTTPPPQRMRGQIYHGSSILVNWWMFVE